MEAKSHERSCFVTLTYSPESLPESGSLVKEHWQKFAKRLRKALGPFRFLHCGEYGEQSFRPHYHALIFGHDFGHDRVMVEASRSSRFPLYRSATLERIWGLGMAPIGAVSWETAAYVARYCVKKLSGPASDAVRRRIDLATGEEYLVAPEYMTMSRRPGLGAAWYRRWKEDCYPSDFVVQDGRKLPVPRYFDRLCEREAPEVLEPVKASRRRSVGRRREDLSQDRLEAGEAIAVARFGLRTEVL